jgi:hypothetical protein
MVNLDTGPTAELMGEGVRFGEWYRIV